jgi:hypothetical protein
VVEGRRLARDDGRKIARGQKVPMPICERAPSRFERLGELLGTAGEGVLATEGVTRVYTGGDG